MQHNNATFHWPVRVYYEDTDSGGVVYHTNYLKFMERGRTEMLRARGLEQDRLKSQDGFIFAVKTASIEFKQPARFNEQLIVVTEIVENSRIAITFYQSIFKIPGTIPLLDDVKAALNQGDALCAGKIKVVSLDAKTMKPRRMAASLLKEIVSVE